jgi:putative drug exporter of the RND superfamily
VAGRPLACVPDGCGPDYGSDGRDRRGARSPAAPAGHARDRARAQPGAEAALERIGGGEIAIADLASFAEVRTLVDEVATATVVRMVLVPAVMQLLGDRNWWIPGWLERILPRLDVERVGMSPAEGRA